MKIAQAPASLMVRKEASAEFKDKTAREEARGKEKDQRTVRVADVTVSEGLSKESVLRLVQKKIDELKECSIGSEPAGKLVIELTVSPTGKLITAKIVSSPFKNKSAEQCLLEHLKKWQYPSIKGGQEAKVTISLVFGS